MPCAQRVPPIPLPVSDPQSAIRGQFVVLGDEVHVGDGVKIWNFVYVGSRVRIGDRVSIGSLVHIGFDVEIGADTLIEGHAYISDLTRIGSRCFIGPNVTITNDPFPPVRRSTGVAAWVGVTIEDDAIVAAGATLKAGVRIGRGAVVGMGAAVVHDVPPETVVVGVPARPVYDRAEYDRRQRAHADRAAGAQE